MFDVSNMVALDETTDAMREEELQSVFDNWSSRSASPGYEIVGWPADISPSPAGVAPAQLSWVQNEFYFTADTIWNAPSGTFAIELKAAYKYQPLVLAQALQTAEQLTRQQGAAGAPVVPVLVTRYSQWIRGSVAWLLRNGFSPHALRYVEFVRLRGPGPRSFLWFEEPFVPAVSNPSGPPGLTLNMTATPTWYNAGVTPQYFATRSPISLSPPPPFWWVSHVRCSAVPATSDTLVCRYEPNPRPRRARDVRYYLA